MFNQASSEFGFNGLQNDSNSVKTLQTALNDYLSKTGGYTALKVDGLLGNNTYQALQEAKNRALKTLDSFNQFKSYDLNKYVKWEFKGDPKKTETGTENKPKPTGPQSLRNKPFKQLNDNMLNGTPIKDFDSLIDYMYASPNSDFTKGFMNMVYANIQQGTLPQWNPNVETQWNYLRNNKRQIEKIAGIKGRYGNGILGTSGDYQDLIHSINRYA
jgi:hypothetical protein